MLNTLGDCKGLLNAFITTFLSSLTLIKEMFLHKTKAITKKHNLSKCREEVTVDYPFPDWTSVT